MVRVVIRAIFIGHVLDRTSAFVSVFLLPYLLKVMIDQ